jgi:hypothetical protein
VLAKAMKRSLWKEVMAVPEATHEELAAAALKTTMAPALTAQAAAAAEVASGCGCPCSRR